MKKHLFIGTLLFLFFSLSVLYISAQMAEAELVSDIYSSGPQIESVINKVKESLTETEKFSYCLDKFFLSQGTPFDVFIKGSSFSDEYDKMYGEDINLDPGAEYEYEGYLSYLSKNYGHRSIFYITDNSYVKASDIMEHGLPYLQYYKHFIDYDINHDSLYINIGVLIIDPDNANNQELEFLDYIKKIADEQQNNVDYDTYEDEDKTVNNYFLSNEIKSSIWGKYSDLYTIYTMKYNKNINGEWYWVSCTISNPNTSTTNPYLNIIFIMIIFSSLFFISLIYTRKKRTNT